MRNDTITWSPEILVHKYSADTLAAIADHLGHEPSGGDLIALRESGHFPADDAAHEEGNLLTTAGVTRIMSLLAGAGGAAFNNAQAIVGVGTSTTAAAVADTKLGGDGSTSTAYYQGADASYPTVNAGVLTCYSTFGTANANFAWNEWCFAIATGTLTPGATLASVGTSPILMNHKAPVSLGTKSAGTTWQSQLTLSIS